MPSSQPQYWRPPAASPVYQNFINCQRLGPVQPVPQYCFPFANSFYGQSNFQYHQVPVNTQRRIL